MSNQTKEIAIIGAGVSGLSCGVLLAEAGHKVTIYSSLETSQTNSAKAAAFWYPHKVSFNDRVLFWARETYLEFEKLAKDSSSGVCKRNGFRFVVGEDTDVGIRGILEDYQEISLQAFDFEYDSAFRFTTYLSDSSIYLKYLEMRFVSAGGEICSKIIEDARELAGLGQLVVNCSALGAKAIFSDEQIYPIRAQMLRVSKPPQLEDKVMSFEQDGGLTNMIVRINDCLLGSTVEPNKQSLEFEPEMENNIRERTAKFDPILKKAEILSRVVGLRPARDEVRLELDNSYDIPVIHNYGHGGAGYTLSWGCAKEVLGIVEGIS